MLLAVEGARSSAYLTEKLRLRDLGTCPSIMEPSGGRIRLELRVPRSGHGYPERASLGSCPPGRNMGPGPCLPRASPATARPHPATEKTVAKAHGEPVRGLGEIWGDCSWVFTVAGMFTRSSEEWGPLAGDPRRRAASTSNPNVGTGRKSFL